MSSNNKHHVKQSLFLKEFSCVGAECIDTCCRDWEMQLDPAQQIKFKQEAPDLLDAITPLGNSVVMKRDACSGECIKFQDGLCSIQSTYGEEFLGDACYFYPRLTRKMKGDYVMTGSLSCPEVARLVLFDAESPFDFYDVVVKRLPYIIDDYCPEMFGSQQVYDIMQRCLSLVDQGGGSHVVMLRLVLLAKALEGVGQETWRDAIPGMWRDTLLHMPQSYSQHGDGYFLIATLVMLLASSKHSVSRRLYPLLQLCECVFSLTIDYENGSIAEDPEQFSGIDEVWRYWNDRDEALLEPVLLRWIKSQLCVASFPFAGFGNSLSEVILIISIRYATIRLFLAVYAYDKQASLTCDEVIDVVQPVSRFMDHLANPTLSFSLYQAVGWSNMSRLRGLLELGDIT